jgi:hypothetical protein
LIVITLFGAVLEAVGVVGLVDAAGDVDGLGDAEFAVCVEGDGDAPGAPG